MKNTQKEGKTNKTHQIKPKLQIEIKPESFILVP
jgi:hypothetical protein